MLYEFRWISKYLTRTYVCIPADEEDASGRGGKEAGQLAEMGVQVESVCIGGLGGVGDGFSEMQGDLDQQRLLGERPPSTDPLTNILAKEIQHQER